MKNREALFAYFVKGLLVEQHGILYAVVIEILNHVMTQEEDL